MSFASTNSASAIDLFAQYFYDEPIRYIQLLEMAFECPEPLEKTSDSENSFSVITKLATSFRNDPELLLALNAILSKEYRLIFALESPMSVTHTIDRIIIASSKESCIVDLDVGPESQPSNASVVCLNSLPFRTTSQIRVLADAERLHEMHIVVERKDAPLVMELLQAELDRTRTGSDLRGRYLKSFRHLNRLHGVLPPSMYLRDIVCEGCFPVAGGGFSDVWIGRLGEQRVCVKVLRMFTQHENRENLFKSLNKEVFLWRQLKHPNILPFLGINTELFRPSYCIISPWMSNGDIISYASKSSLDIDRKLEYAYQIATGLAYLHGLEPPVVHGDIKGANILIADDARCCLADFGLSVMDTQSFNPTHSTTIQGSLRWLAPEFINPTSQLQPVAGSLTSRDIYAFGCTVVELLTGAPPFSQHKMDIHVAIDVLNGVRPTLPVDLMGNEGISKILCPLLDSCWSEQIARRPKALDLYMPLLELTGSFLEEMTLEEMTLDSGWDSASDSTSESCSATGWVSSTRLRGPRPLVAVPNPNQDLRKLKPQPYHTQQPQSNDPYLSEESPVAVDIHSPGDTWDDPVLLKAWKGYLNRQSAMERLKTLSSDD